MKNSRTVVVVPHLVRGAFITTIAAALSLVGTPVPAHAQQLGYTLAPTATRLTWDDRLPLDEGWLYGGRLSMLFGSQVELQPFFMRGTKFGADSSRAASVFGTNSLKRSLGIEHAGANVQINLSNSDLSPFVRAGGGILKFTPDSGAEIKRLTVLGGGGVRLNLGGIQGEVFAEQMRFRMTPGRLFGKDTAALPAGEKPPTLKNLTYGAAVTIPLSTFEGAQTSGLRGTRAPIEPFVGRLAFNKAMGLGDQDLMGVRAGLDFSPLVGVRGFYWRGVNDDHDRTVPISGYGGEAQFTLNDGLGVTPYVVMGAGRIDFKEEYRDDANKSREDQSALIIGGGAQFSLTERFHLNVAIRDFVTTRSDVLSSANQPDDLLHSRMLSAGFTFALGGNSSGARERARVRELANERERGVERQSVVERESGEERDRAVTRASIATETARSAQSKRSVKVAADSEFMVTEISRLDSVRIALPNASGKMVVLPVPTVGEIIIRYGLPAKSDTVVVDSVVRVIRMGDSTTVRSTVPLTSANTERVSDLQRQVSMLEQELERARRDRESLRDEQESMRNRVDSGRGGPSFLSRLVSSRPSDIVPFVGLSTGDGTQLVVNGRIDLGPMHSASALDLVPELSLAVGDGRTTIMGMANARYSFGAPGSVRPYVMVGGGLSNNTLFVLGTSVGASVNLRSVNQKPLYGFGEIQGINFFNQTRLLVGFSYRR